MLSSIYQRMKCRLDDNNSSTVCIQKSVTSLSELLLGEDVAGLAAED
jgi:hypothetical protein